MVTLQALDQTIVMKRVFLTGASSGIGRAIAHALLARGDEVWGTSRNLERIPKMPRCHPVRLDLTDPLSVEQAFNAALAVFGQIQLIQLALRHMQARGEGLVINVTSLASRLPVPFMSAYNAAKAALASFTMSIQLELGNSRVHVVDLQPADIRTEFNQGVIKSAKADRRYDAKVTKTWEVVERVMKNAPSPDLVARHVLKLINADRPPPRITVGDVFQSKIAPLIFRFLPQRVRLWGLKRYYGL